MKSLLISLAFLALTACTGTIEKQMKTDPKAMEKFEAFRKKEKFLADSTFAYSGVGDEKLRLSLAERINAASDDFKKVALSEKPTNKKYLDKIKIGLARFSGLNLDSEDQERICHYFEELMDIVGLESSDGQLNTFRYGFNPTR